MRLNRQPGMAKRWAASQFLAPPEQSQTLFAVVDIGTSAHGIEFGIGYGFTPASDTTVIKLMLMQGL
jgi:hypothetical protein